MPKDLYGLKVLSTARNSVAYKAGLRRGDLVLSVNGEETCDDLDFKFYSSRTDLTVLIKRKNKLLSISIRRTRGEDLGIRFKDYPIRRCCNKCVFCFIDQMPPGLRKSLYVKDEDYRYSFTNGNYLTLSRATRAQLSHIIELGLSPLYVSVHVTDIGLRRRMLGNTLAFDIMDQLRFLEKNDMRFHTQIVVCPGINDGRALALTVRDLLTLKNGLLSIAVVPVGLTRHKKITLQPVTMSVAEKICKDLGAISDVDKEKTGERKIFLADEFFIKAKMPIPGNEYYEEYPQIENGVGLLRQLLSEWKKLKKRIRARNGPIKKAEKTIDNKKYLALTSVSAFSYIQSIFHEMEEVIKVRIEVKAVNNTFFGETVTVAGLLTAHDVIKSAKPVAGSYSAIFIPDVMLNTHGHTMDGYSIARIQKKIMVPVQAVSNLHEMANMILREKNWS